MKTNCLLTCQLCTISDFDTNGKHSKNLETWFDHVKEYGGLGPEPTVPVNPADNVPADPTNSYETYTGGWAGIVDLLREMMIEKSTGLKIPGTSVSSVLYSLQLDIHDAGIRVDQTSAFSISHFVV